MFKIVSGGQNGVDLLALEVANSLGIITGGLAPQNYMTSTGSNLDLRDKYGLTEDVKAISLSASYVLRSIKNVDNTDGTLAFQIVKSVGTSKTVGYCLHKKWMFPKTDNMDRPHAGHKPVLVIKDLENEDDLFRKIIDFINTNNILSLNVAGNRDIIAAHDTAIRSLLTKVFGHVKEQIN